MTPLKNAVSFNLQFFAEEMAADTGDNNSAPPVADTGETSFTAAPPVADTATDNTSDTEIQNDISGESTRLSFKELIKNEDTAKEAKEYINQKFGERFNEKIKSQEDQLTKMRDILDFENMRYGLDPDSDTYLDDLGDKIKSDAKLFEDEALAEGMDRDTFLKVKQAERIIEQNKRDSAQRERQEIISNHISNLRQQEIPLREKYPDFDLESEMNNKTFRHLVDPPALGGIGLSLENAYYAIHYKEINSKFASQVVNKATAAVANSMAVNKSRPAENVNAKTAATVPTKSFKDWKKEDFDKARDAFNRSGISPF